ncbi:MAG: hypothetical protein NUW37_00525 [Planctomycetes bacterium]|nr:hypothetical protein [Planctomycetota bacterium]
MKSKELIEVLCAVKADLGSLLGKSQTTDVEKLVDLLRKIGDADVGELAKQKSAAGIRKSGGKVSTGVKSVCSLVTLLEGLQSIAKVVNSKSKEIEGLKKKLESGGLATVSLSEFLTPTKQSKSKAPAKKTAAKSGAKSAKVKLSAPDDIHIAKLKAKVKEIVEASDRLRARFISGNKMALDDFLALESRRAREDAFSEICIDIAFAFEKGVFSNNLIDAPWLSDREFYFDSEKYVIEKLKLVNPSIEILRIIGDVLGVYLEVEKKKKDIIQRFGYTANIRAMHGLFEVSGKGQKILS